MTGDRTPRPVRALGALGEAEIDFPLALAASDAVAARSALRDALDAGSCAGHVYRQVVRPALRHTVFEGLSAEARRRAALTRSIARAAVADLALRHPVGTLRH